MTSLKIKFIARNIKYREEQSPFNRKQTDYVVEVLNLKVKYSITYQINQKICCEDKNLTMSPIKTNINGMLHKANPSGAKFPLIQKPVN